MYYKLFGLMNLPSSSSASSEKLIIKTCDSLSVHLGGFRIPVNHNNSFEVPV